ncbi:MAG: hypothetical protein WC091_11765 [Sulfuricellaceae bacterium]
MCVTPAVPEQLTEEQLARLGLAIVTALQALRKQIEYTNVAMRKAGKATSYKLPENAVIHQAARHILRC